MDVKELTKFQKAKIVVSVMYNTENVCTCENKKQWKEVKEKSKINTNTLNGLYLIALKLLAKRSKAEGFDYLRKWVLQSVEGKQIE